MAPGPSPHLEAIPRVGSLTAGRLAGGDLQHLGGQAHRPLDLEVLVLGPLEQDLTDCRAQNVLAVMLKLCGCLANLRGLMDR